MTPTETPPPAVARRRVSLALRRAREAKQWTQTQVANAMDWSLSKVMRIEKGQVNVSPSDLKLLLELLDVTDPVDVHALVAAARVSRNERYSSDGLDRQHLSLATVELLQYEMDATQIQYYNNAAIPGILQSAEYAQAMMENYRDYLDDDAIAARLAARLGRRPRLLKRSPAPDYLVLLDEVVLRKPIGGGSVMLRQLRLLADLMTEGAIRVRVTPLDRPTPLSFFGPFMILDFGGPENAVVYREIPSSTDEIIHATTEVERHRTLFERAWAANALDETASIELIHSVEHTYR